jgi:hypothetical protein
MIIIAITMLVFPNRHTHIEEWKKTKKKKERETSITTWTAANLGGKGAIAFGNRKKTGSKHSDVGHTM